MTISSDEAVAGPLYPNGVTVAFPFDIALMSASEVQVGRLQADGSMTILNPALYTVTLGVDGEGGTVTFTVAPATIGGDLFIIAAPAFEQEIEFEDEGPFNASILNPLADRSAARSIYLKSLVGRAALVPFGEAGVTLPSVALRAGNALAFDVTGKPVAVPADSFAITTQMTGIYDATVAVKGQVDTQKALVDTAKGQVDTAKAAADADVLLTHADVGLTHADAITTGLNAASASASLAALLAAVASGSVNTFASTADALSNGVIGYTVTAAGTGGTSGTYNLTLSGGAGTQASARAVVSGGGIIDIKRQAKGRGYTSAPAVTFTGITGLTGAAVTAVIGPNTVDGDYFAVVDATNGSTLIYQNVAGVAVFQFATPSGVSFVALAPETGFSMAIGGYDADGFNFRAVMLIDLVGNISFVGSVVLPAASISTAMLDATTQAYLMQPLAPETGYSFAVGGYDADGFTFRAAYLVALDGTPIANMDARSAIIINRPLMSRPNTNFGLMQLPNGDGTAKIETIARTVPLLRRQVAASGSSPVITPDDWVLFDNPAALPPQRAVPAIGGTDRPAIPYRKLLVTGDSQVAQAGGAAISPTRLSDLFSGWSIIGGFSGNNVLSGVVSQRSDQILMRLVGCKLTVSGGSIPTSGTAALTLIEPITAVAGDYVARQVPTTSGTQTAGPLAYMTSASMAGSILGQACTLAISAGGVYSIAQIGGTGALAVPAGTPFIPTLGGVDEAIGCTNLGTNNVQERQQVRNDRAAWRAAIRTYFKWTIDIGVSHNWSLIPSDTTYIQARQVCADMVTDAGPEGFACVDVWKLMRGDAPYNGTGTSVVVNADGSRTFPSWAARMGVTLSSSSLDDIANLKTPRQAYNNYLTDGLHYSASVQGALNATLFDIANLNGWTH